MLLIMSSSLMVKYPKNALASTPPMNPPIAISLLSESYDWLIDNNDLIPATRHPKERKIEPSSPRPSMNISKEV